MRTYRVAIAHGDCAGDVAASLAETHHTHTADATLSVPRGARLGHRGVVNTPASTGRLIGPTKRNNGSADRREDKRREITCYIIARTKDSEV